MKIWRTLIAVPVATAITLGAAGCTGEVSDSTRTPASATGGASADPRTSAPAPDDEGARREKLTPANFAERLTEATLATGSVSMDLIMTMDAEVLLTADADLVFGDGPSMRMEMRGLDVDARLIFVDGFAYVDLGEPTGGKYVLVDPSDPTDPLASAFTGLEAQADPTAQVADTADAYVSVERSGPVEEMDGVTVWRYEVVVDTSLVTGTTRKTLDESGSLVPRTLTYHYWIDAQDRHHRVEYELGPMTTTMKLTDWGEIGPITAPGPDEIVERPAAGA